ncbi:unnamed protein product [Callosobruchus maculatus]|uniref:TRAF3-interacting protein 1 n=1 Tax=Callosobruchus maculatus TaxID=64391 RepID=A0A653C5A0_CALMS|nr:unnamed protein product [Callosobruchus maculatus]
MDDITAEIVKKTQISLGKYVKKPPLTEKLLRKPPFRFLHDVIKAVIKETNFLKGLFTDDELRNENITDKDAKIAFLNKLIDAVKTVTKTDLPVRASKIVAGLEPTNTNILLQTIGKALDAKIDTSEYVSNLKLAKGSSNNKKSKTKVGTNLKSSSKTSIDKEKQVETKKKSVDSSKSKTKVSSTPREKEKDKNKLKNKINDEKKEVEVATKKSENVPAKIIDANLNETEVIIDTTQHNIAETKSEETLEIKNSETSLVSQSERDADSDQKSEVTVPHDSNKELKNNNGTSTRPKSAKPKSGEQQSKHKQNTNDILQTVPAGTSNIEASAASAVPRVSRPSARPRSSLRPPSVRPSSARPGAPRLRPDSALPMQEPVAMGSVKVIVENVDAQDDDDTVVVENVDVKDEEEPSNVEIPLDNKGHLVEQILEQIQEGEGKKKIEIDWEYDSHAKDAVSKELSNLRALIQNVTKTTSPLGKLMNYLHEDIDAMYSELEMWTNTRKQLYSEIKKKKKLNDDSMKPMHENLNRLQEDINKLQQEILSVQSTIIRNDLRINELLSK